MSESIASPPASSPFYLRGLHAPVEREVEAFDLKVEGAIPPELAEWDLELEDDGHALCYEFDANAERTGVPSLLRRMSDLGIGFKDLNTRQSSLEDIFVSLVHRKDAA